MSDTSLSQKQTSPDDLTSLVDVFPDDIARSHCFPTDIPRETYVLDCCDGILYLAEGVKLFGVSALRLGFRLQRLSLFWQSVARYIDSVDWDPWTLAFFQM